MPIPNFVPLIGSGFDALAGQQQQWAGFNRGVEESNINRAAAAEAAQNRWLEQVARAQADAQQQELAARYHADEIARSDAFQRRAEAEQRRQFDVGTTIDKARIAAENTRTAEMSKVANTNAQLQQHAADQKIESLGQSAASSYLIAKNTAEAANKAYERVQSQIDEAETEQQAELSKEIKKRDPAKVASLTQKIKALSGSLRQATTDKQRSENNFQALANRIQNEGFSVDLDNEQVIHSPTGKRWSFKDVLSKAKANLDPGGETNLPSRPEDPGSEMWAGMKPSAQPTSAATSPQEVIRLTKDGRQAVFDAVTKKFLRYADAQ